MLCSIHGYNEICTNRCPDRPTCTKHRIPLLIEALDILPSDIEFGEKNGVFYTDIKYNCVAPEAYINGLIYSMLDQERPSVSFVPCAYCGGAVMMPTSQKEEFSVENPEKYNKYTIAYCSKDCQTKHLQKFRESKSLAFGNLKNREYALVVHGADVSKRPKEKEVHIITGNYTEQRARCLFEKLQSLTPYKKQKSLTSLEVQGFLLKDLPDELKSGNNKIEVTAWRVMNKCAQLFPDMVLIQYYKEKSREIVLIK